MVIFLELKLSIGHLASKLLELELLNPKFLIRSEKTLKKWSNKEQIFYWKAKDKKCFYSRPKAKEDKKLYKPKANWM